MAPLAARVLNASFVPAVHQADLCKDTEIKPDPAVWEDITVAQVFAFTCGAVWFRSKVNP